MLIRREVLAATLPVTDDTDTRFFLGAIQIEPSGRAVATNGHVLIMAIDRNPIPDEDFPLVPGADFKGSPTVPVLLPATQAKRLIAASKPARKSYIPALQTVQVSTNGAPNSVTIAATDLQTPTIAHVVHEEGQTFPQYERVLPALDRSVVRLTLSRDVLETLLAAVKGASGSSKQQYGGLLTFEIPIGLEAQGRGYSDDPHSAPDADGRCIHCGDRVDHTNEETRCMRPDGYIATAVRVRCSTQDVDLDMVAMPCRK